MVALLGAEMQATTLQEHTKLAEENPFLLQAMGPNSNPTTGGGGNALLVSPPTWGDTPMFITVTSAQPQEMDDGASNVATAGGSEAVDPSFVSTNSEDTLDSSGTVNTSCAVVNLKVRPGCRVATTDSDVDCASSSDVHAIPADGVASISAVCTVDNSGVSVSAASISPKTDTTPASAPSPAVTDTSSQSTSSDNQGAAASGTKRYTFGSKKNSITVSSPAAATTASFGGGPPHGRRRNETSGSSSSYCDGRVTPSRKKKSPPNPSTTTTAAPAANNVGAKDTGASSSPHDTITSEASVEVHAQATAQSLDNLSADAAQDDASPGGDASLNPRSSSSSS